MKSTLIITLALGIAGCDLGDKSINPVELLSATVQLTDTTGRETTTFHTAENFDINFKLTNMTGKRLTFYRGSSAPDVLFIVFRGDSVVASSIDGYVFAMVISAGYLEPGQTMRGHWRGPTTPFQYPKVLLARGVYRLTVSFPIFDQAETKGVPAIEFSIIE